LLAWVLLARNGFPPRKWSIDDKQPYGKHLVAYRNGNPRPLNLFMIKLAR